MTKRRPVIVLSNQMKTRPNLCTVVACSTTPPSKIMPYHYLLNIKPPLPAPYDSPTQWIKGDMVYSFSFRRLNLPFIGKNPSGKRKYDIRIVGKKDLSAIENCVKRGLGMKI